MMFVKKITFIILFVSISCSILGQVDVNFSYDPLCAPNTYRSPQNPYYWGNKSEKSTAWQQDVHYSIKAKLDENQNRIDGIAKVTYWNNSEDSISQVFFHLFQNSFLENSYKNLYLKSIGKPANTEEFLKKGIEIKDFRIFVGKSFSRPVFEVDNSILKVDLSSPLRPNSFIVFSINFTTYFDKSKEVVPCEVFEEGGNKVFKAANWYPKICRYDVKTGWESNQYLGLNSAGTFGAYDVQIETPIDYVTEATGFNSENPNFNDPFKSNSTGSSSSNIWNYHAENVNDFVFVSSPNFERKSINSKKKKIVYLNQKHNKSNIDSSLFYLYSSIDFMEHYLGRISQNKFVISDISDTDSHPMMLFISGEHKNNKELICKLVSDQWLSSMMILDEEKNMLLKEGLSLYLCSKILNKISNSELKTPELNAGLTHSISNNLGLQILNSPETARSNLQLRSYQLFLQLECILGEEKLLHSIKTFFTKWRFERPFVSDLISSLNRQNNTDFTELFRQWTVENSSLEYRIESVSLYANSSKNNTIKIKRIGNISMPVNILIESKTNQAYKFCIPAGNLPVDKEAQVLPVWLGFGDFNREYSFTCKIEGGIKRIVLDPDEKMLDMDRSNNFWSEE